jgi:hypothetical protein
MGLAEEVAEYKMRLEWIDTLRKIVMGAEKTTGAADLAITIRRRLLNGETTGDPLEDAAILVCHQPDEKITTRLREVQNLLAGKKGQLVLLVTHEEKDENPFNALHDSRGIHAREHYYRLETSAWAGILAGESLILEAAKAMCFLPTDRYAMIAFGIPKVNIVKIIPENMPLGNFIREINEPIVLVGRESREALGKDPVRAQLIVGNDAVEEWFSSYDGGIYTSQHLIVVDALTHSAQAA